MSMPGFSSLFRLLLLVISLIPAVTKATAQPSAAQNQATAEDHRNMMEQLGIKALRRVQAAMRTLQSCELR